VLVANGKRALLVACVLLVAAGTSEGAPSPIVDRTFSCTVGTLSQLDVTTSPRGSIGAGGRSDDVSPGYVSVGSGAARGVFDDLVFARARTEARRSATPFPPGVYADVRRCIRARASVPLSSRGLPGPPVRFNTDADCAVGGRVLVRLRAVLEGPAPWGRSERPYFGARRNVVEATIAIRSDRGRRPIALLALDRKGETRLWVSSNCS
jgi:hypothetical protein